MYDRHKTMVVHGTVKAFNWTNPHVLLELQADPDGPGRGELWTLETTSPGTLVRSGWSKRSLNPGDRVTVEFNPLTAGGLGGNFSKVTLADGKVLGWSFTPQDLQGR